MPKKIHPSKIKTGMRLRPAKETTLYAASGHANAASRIPTPAVIEAVSDARLADNGLSALEIRLAGKNVAVRITGFDVEVI